MLSNILDRISFWSLFAVIVLLPLFFLPLTQIPVETGKGLLLIVGLAVSIIFWTAARFSDGKIAMPRSWILLSGLGIVIVFLLSTIFSPAVKVSLFGIMLDTGTFYFMLAAFLLMLVSSIILRDIKKARMIFWGILASSLVVLVFQAARMFFPQILSFGIMGGKTDNILGSWNALGLFAGFAGIISLFVIEFFSISKTIKWLLGALIVFSIFTAAAVNILFIWLLLGIFALIIFIYKVSLSYGEKNEGEGAKKSQFPVFCFVIVMISLLFSMSGQYIGSSLPNALGLSNIEIRPSFSTTMSVTGQALKKSPVLGIGPNRFEEAWTMYKPASINSSQFWDTSFASGSGLLPTFASTTGFLGVLAWLVFFYLLIASGVKSLFSSMKNNVNKEMTVFFIAAIYLFVSSFFYSTGPVIFLLAFAFTGAYIGLSSSNKEKNEVSFSFLNDPRKSFFSILLLVILMLVSAATVFKYAERFASITYFGRTLSASTIPAAESSIIKAVTLYSNDLYLRTYSQVYLTKINSLVSQQSISDADKATLQASFDQAVNSSQLATQYDKTNYLNFSSLGVVYNTVGLLGVEGAYNKAIEAYNTASTLNPLNPGIKLALSRVSFANKKVDDARKYAKEAIDLKSDYIDAYLVLSQIEKSEGNNSDAISYAETALSFDPSNKDLIQYVNSLKNGSAVSQTPALPQAPVTPSAKP